MASQMVCLAAKSFSWKIKIILTDADMLTCPGPAVLCFALAGIFSSAVKRSIGSTIGFHDHREGPLKDGQVGFSIVPVPYDNCVGVPISRLLTVGSIMSVD